MYILAYKQILNSNEPSMVPSLITVITLHPDKALYVVVVYLKPSNIHINDTKIVII